MLSGLLRCHCGAHFVMDSKTHYRCGKALDGKSCKKQNYIRVRREVAERVILTPVDDQLSPDMVEQLTREARAYYAARTAALKTQSEKRRAEVAELDARITRLRDRLKAGDDDMEADEILAVIESAERKLAALLAARPEAKRNEKILLALPQAAKQLRDQIKRGLSGNPAEAARARGVA